MKIAARALSLRKSRVRPWAHLVISTLDGHIPQLSSMNFKKGNVLFIFSNVTWEDIEKDLEILFGVLTDF